MSTIADSKYRRELEVAQELALRAGALTLRIRRGEDLEVEMKEGDEPVTVADRESSRLIVKGLREAFPEDVIISEENSDDLRRLEAERVWYIDPIDGTKDFIRGENGFSVMIGLCIDHRPTVGVVYQPDGDRLFSAAPDLGALFRAPGEAPRKTVVSEVSDVADIRLVASKSHRSKVLDSVKSALGISNELNIGSVGLKLSVISLGERDLYVNPSPRCKVWDTCAPEAILDAAGGRMTDLHGRPLRYDAEDTSRPGGLVASNGRIHDPVIAKLTELFPDKLDDDA